MANKEKPTEEIVAPAAPRTLVLVEEEVALLYQLMRKLVKTSDIDLEDTPVIGGFTNKLSTFLNQRG